MNVAVVIGDVRKPDPVEPSATYGEIEGELIDQLKVALDSLPEYRFTFLDNHDTLLHDLQALQGQVPLILNLGDAGYNNSFGRELHLPALFEILGFHYTGAGPQGLAYCYDKALMGSVAQHLGIPVPASILLRPGESGLDWPFGFPAIVKPNQGHGSVGITMKSVAKDPQSLAGAVSSLREAVGMKPYLLVQEFLPGKEIDVGVLGNTPADTLVLPMLAKDYTEAGDGFPQIACYELKWVEGFPEFAYTPAHLPAATERLIQDWSVELFARLGCRDYARVEWRLDGTGAPKLIEVNPNPDWSRDSALADMAGRAGIPYPELLRTILRAAQRRLETAAG